MELLLFHKRLANLSFVSSGVIAYFLGRNRPNSALLKVARQQQKQPSKNGRAAAAGADKSINSAHLDCFAFSMNYSKKDERYCSDLWMLYSDFCLSAARSRLHTKREGKPCGNIQELLKVSRDYKSTIPFAKGPFSSWKGRRRRCSKAASNSSFYVDYKGNKTAENGDLPKKVEQIYSEIWLPERLDSEKWLSSLFNIRLNCNQKDESAAHVSETKGERKHNVHYVSCTHMI